MKGREGENDLTHHCRKFMATPLDNWSVFAERRPRVRV